MITTADTQGRQGGVQLIYDAFWEEIYTKIPDSSVSTESNNSCLWILIVISLFQIKN